MLRHDIPQTVLLPCRSHTELIHREPWTLHCAMDRNSSSDGYAYILDHGSKCNVPNKVTRDGNEMTDSSWKKHSLTKLHTNRCRYTKRWITYVSHEATKKGKYNRPQYQRTLYNYERRTGFTIPFKPTDRKQKRATYNPQRKGTPCAKTQPSRQKSVSSHSPKCKNAKWYWRLYDRIGIQVKMHRDKHMSLDKRVNKDDTTHDTTSPMTSSNP